ncbi:hypothetical protein D3C84_696800 [compost metagenome]
MEGATQDLPFLADPWNALHLEAHGDQSAAHPAGAGEGAQGGIGGRQATDLGEQLRSPHLRVLRRGETVEEPGVDGGVELRQLFEDITDHQGQAYPALLEDKALEAFMYRHVLRQQLSAERRQFRPQGQGAAEVGVAERVLFDTDEMQAGVRIGAFAEQLPGTEKVQPGAEAGFTDHQALFGQHRAEALAQVILVDEHMTGFFQALVLGEIDVIELA